MSQYFPKYRKSKRWPYNPPQDPRFYRVFDMWLKIAISIAIIIIAFLIVRPDFNDMWSYLTWVIVTVGCIALMIVASRYLPPFLYGYVMINKRYWQIDYELQEMQQYIDKIAANDRDALNQGDAKAELDEPPQKEEIDIERMNLSNKVKNASQRLEQFMATVEMERKAMEERRKAEDAERLEKVLRYTRQSFMELGLTDEELFQLNECVRLFCTERSVLSTPLIKIYKKPNIKQADIKNFAWNIGNVYGYPLDLTAQFVCATFPAWFANTERTTVERTLRTTRGQVNIEIDPNLLSHLE